MSTNTAGRNQSHGHNSDSIDTTDIDATVQSFIDSTINLAHELDAPDSVIDDFIDSANGLAQLVGETAHKASDADEEVNDE